MARPWRIQYPDAVYHIISRGNRQADIFLTDQDRHDFINLLSKTGERFGVEMFAFCLMNNHYHLFLRTPLGNLSLAMHWLNTTYTTRFNRRHRINGHLFQGRYKSVLVTDEIHWHHLSIYLHLNPVRAGLVKEPADYPWSSFRDYIMRKPRFAWLRKDEILDHYGSNPALQRKNYHQDCLVLSGIHPGFWKRFRTEMILGSRAAREELAKKHRPRGDTSTVPEFKRAQKSDDLDSALRKLAEFLSVELSELKNKRGELPLREIAYWHLVSNCRWRAIEVGKYFGVGVSAVSMGIRRLEEKMSKDRALSRKLRALCEM